jgi:hypothetical protein
MYVPAFGTYVRANGTYIPAFGTEYLSAIAAETECWWQENFGRQLQNMNCQRVCAILKFSI